MIQSSPKRVTLRALVRRLCTLVLHRLCRCWGPMRPAQMLQRHSADFQGSQSIIQREMGQKRQTDEVRFPQSALHPASHVHVALRIGRIGNIINDVVLYLT
jgi:hypothetical protein